MRGRGLLWIRMRLRLGEWAERMMIGRRGWD